MEYIGKVNGMRALAMVVTNTQAVRETQMKRLIMESDRRDHVNLSEPEEAASRREECPERLYGFGFPCFCGECDGSD